MDLETRRRWGQAQVLGTFSGSGTHTAKIPAKTDGLGAVKYHVMLDAIHLSTDDASSVRPRSATVTGPKLRCEADDTERFTGPIEFADGESVDIVCSGVGEYWLTWHYESKGN